MGSFVRQLPRYLWNPSNTEQLETSTGEYISGTVLIICSMPISLALFPAQILGTKEWMGLGYLAQSWPMEALNHGCQFKRREFGWTLQEMTTADLTQILIECFARPHTLPISFPSFQPLQGRILWYSTGESEQGSTAWSCGADGY